MIAVVLAAFDLLSRPLELGEDSHFSDSPGGRHLSLCGKLSTGDCWDAHRLSCEAGAPVILRIDNFGDFAGRMIWQPGEHVGEPGLRIDIVELGGLDQV
jgi:hypothetical protein